MEKVLFGQALGREKSVYVDEVEFDNTIIERLLSYVAVYQKRFCFFRRKQRMAAMSPDYAYALIAPISGTLKCSRPVKAFGTGSLESKVFSMLEEKFQSKPV